MIIERKEYLDELKEIRWNGKVKVINGFRLCGKSFLLFHQFKQYLLDEGVPKEKIIERHLWMHSQDEESEYRLYKEIKELVSDKNEKYYVFLDEIDRLKRPKWILKSLAEQGNVDVYVTGINPYEVRSKTTIDLIDDSSTIFVRPLSFSEFHSFKNGSVKDDWKEYTMYGGIPGIVTMDNIGLKCDLLDQIKEMMDCCEYKRRRLRLPSYVIREIVNHMLFSIGKITSGYKMAARLNREYRMASVNRISDYVYNFCGQYYFGKAEVYDPTNNKRDWSKCRYYVFDVGVHNSAFHFWNVEHPSVTKNIVFNELRRRGFRVDTGVITMKYGSSDECSKERFVIDFLAYSWEHSYQIKFVNSLNEEVKKSVMRTFSFVDDKAKKIVLVGEDISKHYEGGILFVNVQEFLLDKEMVKLER